MEEIRDDHPNLAESIISARRMHGDDTGAYLCFMAVRLIAMHRILKPTGSIYYHCDPTASHYIKMVMDAIFGPKNFRNEIVWCYRFGATGSKQFSRKHDIIFFYNKGKKWTFNKNAVQRKTLSNWANKSGIKTVTEVDWWDIPSINNGERVGYPTQKPLALYERIIEASSNPGDVVLDCFSGSGTTVVAAQQLGREWIAMDMGDVSLRDTQSRIQAIGGTCAVITQAPARTDTGKTNIGTFITPVKSTTKPTMNSKQMKALLIKQWGMICQGCGFAPQEDLYLHLDHIHPRSDGGSNHIHNRMLLCQPCNGFKSNDKTINGLRRHNKNIGRKYVKNDKGRPASGLIKESEILKYL